MLRTVDQQQAKTTIKPHIALYKGRWILGMPRCRCVARPRQHLYSKAVDFCELMNAKRSPPLPQLR